MRNNIIFDKKDFDSLSNFKPSLHFPQEVAISKDLIAVVTNIYQSPFASNQTIFWKRHAQPFLIDAIPENGLISIKDSFVLISTLQYYRTFKNTNSDYIFIQVNDNETNTKSKIRWERPIAWKSYSHRSEPIGLIDLDSLVLSAYGNVLHLPIENLPSSYEIKNSHCRSQ